MHASNNSSTVYSSEEQTADEYLRAFDTKVSAVLARISRATNAADVDSVCTSIDELHGELAAAVHILPAYDVRRAQETLGEVAAERETKSETLAPRKPFRFRRRRRGGSVNHGRETAVGGERSRDDLPSKADAEHDNDESDEVKAGPSVLEIADLDGSNPPIVYDPGSLMLRDVSMTRLRDASVQLADVSGAVRAVDLARCTLFIGPVTGSVHMTNCVDCEVHVAARQIRIHASKGCTFYVLAKSAPIIEDCAGLSFAPLNMTYDGLEAQLEQAGLSFGEHARECQTAISNPSPVATQHGVEWQQVKDFSWLQEGASPNWKTVEKSNMPPLVHLKVRRCSSHKPDRVDTIVGNSSSR